MSSGELRRERVIRVLALAQRIQDASDALGVEVRERLETTSGLSREGIALALSECLETRASSEELDLLLSRVAASARCWVVASANVCTAALRAIALAVATAPRVLVRPSRRDPVLAEIVIRELSADPHFAAAGGAISIEPELLATAGDEVHAYGRDETVAAIATGLAPGVTLRGHGTGFGVAAVEAEDDVAAAAAALARDVVRFDQRGCLSPRVVFAGGSAAQVRTLASAIETALALLSRSVPVGDATRDARAEIALFRRTMEAMGDVHGDEGHLVVAPAAPRSFVLPPVGRVLVVISTDASRVASFLGGASRFVAAVGRSDATSPLARALTDAVPLARASFLGEMQRPPLDGPVDLRVPALSPSEYRSAYSAAPPRRLVR